MKLIWPGGDWYQRRIRPERRLGAVVYDKLLMLAVILGKRDTMKADSESMVVLEGEPNLSFCCFSPSGEKKDLDVIFGLVWFGLVRLVLRVIVANNSFLYYHAKLGSSSLN